MLTSLTTTVKRVIGRVAERIDDKMFLRERFDDRGVCSCTYSGFYTRIDSGAKGRALKDCKNCNGEGISPMPVCELDGEYVDGEGYQ